MKYTWIIIFFLCSSSVDRTEFKQINNGIGFKEDFHTVFKNSELIKINLATEKQFKFRQFNILFDDQLISEIFKEIGTYEIEINADIIRNKYELAAQNISTISSSNELINADIIMKIELMKNGKKINYTQISGLTIKYDTNKQYYKHQKLFNSKAHTGKKVIWKDPTEIELSNIKTKSRSSYNKEGEAILIDYNYRSVVLKPVFKDWIMIGNEIKYNEENRSEIKFKVEDLERDTRIGLILDNPEYMSYGELQADSSIYTTFVSKEYFTNTTPKISIISVRNKMDTFYFAKHLPTLPHFDTLNLVHSKISFIKPAGCGFDKLDEGYERYRY